jgi:hypothetical protein
VALTRAQGERHDDRLETFVVPRVASSRSCVRARRRGLCARVCGCVALELKAKTVGTRRARDVGRTARVILRITSSCSFMNAD